MPDLKGIYDLCGESQGICEAHAVGGGGGENGASEVSEIHRGKIV